MNQLFKDLNSISYTTYHSDGRKFIIWKDEKRNIQLYSVKETGERFDVFDSAGGMLANDLTEDKVVSFIGLDLGRIVVGEANPSKTEKIMMDAAKRQGSDGSFLKELIAGRQKIREKTSGTVKKKKTIDVSDLDLE